MKFIRFPTKNALCPLFWQNSDTHNDNLYHYLTFFLQNMDWRCPVLWKLGSLSIECWLSFCLQVQENHPCKLKLTNCEDRASASKICYQLQVHRGSNFPLQVDKKADILSISLSFELQQMANAGEMSALLSLHCGNLTLLVSISQQCGSTFSYII